MSDLAERLAYLEGQVSTLTALIEKTQNKAYEHLQTHQADSEKEKNLFAVGTTYFIQTNYYSYVGTVADSTASHLSLADAYIVKLLRPLFEELPKLDASYLYPTKDLCLSKAYISNHFEFDITPIKAKLLEIK